MLIPHQFLTAPNPNCYVCAAEPAIHLRIDTKCMRTKEFREEVDVIIDIKGVVVISPEDGETECNEERFMNEMDIGDGIILKCHNFFQNYELNIIIVHTDAEVQAREKL
uniref:Ubiquitin/SUMO-activating enzyme ubiquitin-like domain-containing protein n=1 Tax=Glossina pallidipes TaxID=7398 RepID=A0A1B0A2N4_GLOPL